MLAFIYAHEQGVHGVEVDVAMTKDNEIIVMHDNTLERTMEGAKGEVPHFTYEQIRSMRYRRVTHHEYVIQDPRNRKVESVPPDHAATHSDSDNETACGHCDVSLAALACGMSFGASDGRRR